MLPDILEDKDIKEGKTPTAVHSHVTSRNNLIAPLQTSTRPDSLVASLYKTYNNHKKQ